MKKIIPLFVLIGLLLGAAFINSCKKDPVIPTLSTAAVTNITVSSATSGGTITDDGGAEISARGVCWGPTADPTVAGSKTSDAAGSGSFTSNLSGLTPNTVYHIRAYATNEAGTAYGEDVTFTTTPIVPATLTTTQVSAITLTTATAGGTVLTDGNDAVSARGVCWSLTENPTVSDPKTTDGTGTGAFTSSLSGLQPGVTYHVRAYAVNSAGTSYGNGITFTTSPILVPTLTTAEITSVTLVSAVSGGNITADGGAAVTARGICWATTINPTTANFKTTDAAGTGIFASNMTGLVPGTTYHVRAYAINSAGTAYGNDLTFTTSPVVVPTLTTAVVTGLTYTSATSGGNITADGGGAVTARGICWATTINPTTANFKTTDATAGIGIFTGNMTALTPGTTYHVRAYATNSAGTAYGNDIQFTTTAIAVPTLTTTIASGITQLSAVSGGVITADGGGAITAKGTCWSTSANPTIAGSKTTDTGGNTFVSTLTPLISGTTYHARAYATNSAGTAYGNDITFTTAPATLPVLTTTIPGTLTVSSAVSGGNITSDGNGAITARGVCWSTSQNPTINDLITTNGTGTGSFTSNITSLSAGTKYYVRAYATNSAGTAYGPQQFFNTKIADIDLNTYNTVTIGDQVWMAENLKVTRFRNGDAIPSISGDVSALTAPISQWAYGDNESNVAVYGRLYTFYVGTDSRNVCPTGWSVPTDDELQDLTTFLGGESEAGGKLKATGTTLWQTPNTGATNETGFTALPGGYRHPTGAYYSIGITSYFWSNTPNDATLAWGVGMKYNDAIALRGGYFYNDGVSIRCIKR